MWVLRLSVAWDEQWDMCRVGWVMWDERCEMNGLRGVVWDKRGVRRVVGNERCEMCSVVWDEKRQMSSARWAAEMSGVRGMVGYERYEIYVRREICTVWDEGCEMSGVRWVACERAAWHEWCKMNEVSGVRWVVWDERCEMRGLSWVACDESVWEILCEMSGLRWVVCVMSAYVRCCVRWAAWEECVCEMFVWDEGCEMNGLQYCTCYCGGRWGPTATPRAASCSGGSVWRTCHCGGRQGPAATLRARKVAGATETSSGSCVCDVMSCVCGDEESHVCMIVVPCHVCVRWWCDVCIVMCVWQWRRITCWCHVMCVRRRCDDDEGAEGGGRRRRRKKEGAAVGEQRITRTPHGDVGNRKHEMTWNDMKIRTEEMGWGKMRRINLEGLGRVRRAELRRQAKGSDEKEWDARRCWRAMFKSSNRFV